MFAVRHRQVYEVRRLLRNSRVILKVLQHPHVVLEVDKFGMPVAQSSRTHEHIHDQVKEGGDHESKPSAVWEFVEIGDEEKTFDPEKHNPDCERLEYRLLCCRIVKYQQRRRHKHVDCDGQSVCRLHLRGILEVQHHDDTAGHEYPVDGRNVDLPANFARITDTRCRPQFRLHRVVNEREGPREQRLTCYAGGQCCDDDAEPQHPFRHDRIKGICVSERCPVLRQEPRSLAEVVEQKADFHKPPPDTDVAFATMAEIGVQRFGTRSTEKDGTEYPEPPGVVGEEPVGVVWIQCIKYRKVVADMQRAYCADNEEPDQHDGTERSAENGGAELLKHKHADDDRNYNRQHRLVADVGDQHVQAFHRGGNADGRCDEAVGNERGATQYGGVNQPPSFVTSDERVEGKDSSFPFVISIERQVNVFYGGDDGERPYDTRQPTNDELRVNRVVTGNGLEYVKR